MADTNRDMLVALLLAPLWLAAAGCARCSDEPRVPFKLNPEATEPTPNEPEARTDAALPAAHVFAEPIDQPVLEGSALALTGVRAALEIDLDGDGDHDALALSDDESQGGLRLLVATREQTGFGAPRDVPGFSAPIPPPCTLNKAGLSALSKTKAVLALELGCDPSAGPLPSSSLSLLSLEATPRVYERIDVLGPTPALTLTPQSHDADGDGHDDIVLQVLRSGAAEADAVRLAWLDRPSGLVRDLREPESTLSAWATAAQSRVAKAPAQAIARAELALSLQRGICRELGAPTLVLSGTPGVPCGTMKSTGALLATLVSAYAKTGELRAAFEAYRQLRRVEPQPSGRGVEQAIAALQKLRAEPGISLRRGPEVEPVRTPRVHLPSARFVSESLLYVQRATPVLYDLAESDENAAPSASDQLLRDPSGRLIATAIERTCEGYGVRIERAPPRGSDYVSTPPVATAVLAEAPSLPGCVLAPVPNLADAQPGAPRFAPNAIRRPDDGGFSLLGWAPQGLVAVRGSEVRLVPVASDGRSEPPRVLAPDAPRPAPLPSGVATADGARYVEATPYGVLVYGPASTSVELWRPEGYTAVANAPLEAAISPSAQRVAVVAGRDVYLLERAGAP